MDTENQILKGTKLIKKYQKVKIKNLQQRLDSQNYNIKNIKQNRSQNKIYIYGICFKKLCFVLKCKVDYKNES